MVEALMRVVLNGWFFIHHPHTGTGQYLRALLDWLPQVSADADYHLVTPGASVSPAGWRLYPMTCGVGDLNKLYFEQVLFPLACRRLRADLAHIPYWAPPLFPSAAPLVVTIHDLIPRLLPHYRGGVLARAYTALASAATPRASLILADSEASRLDILHNLGLPENKVRRIYLAADQRYRPDGDFAADQACRRKYGLPEKYGLYLGGFDARKNVPALLEAWAQGDLARHSPLVLAGPVPPPDGRLFADYPGLTDRLGLTGAVKFIGPVDEADKPALYRGAAVFVYPSRYEGFGLPPLEAMASGTPVVTTRCASLPEVVGEAALVVSPDDPRALGRAILACLTEPGTAQALRERGLQQARQFSWEKTARDTAEAYAAAAAARRP
jgi:glycosyltransferase involved in cell wall biosynthesis